MENSENFDISSDCSDFEDDLVLDKIVNRLTDFVRQQYCGYLEKLLTENYKNWCMHTLKSQENPPESWIKECVNIYEGNAIKSCMIVQFYRHTMLKTMTKIRKFTMNGKLADKIKLYSDTGCYKKESINFVTVATQTEDTIQDNLIDTTFENKRRSGYDETNLKIFKRNELSLDQRLTLFKKRLMNTELSENFLSKRARCAKRYNFCKNPDQDFKSKEVNQLDKSFQKSYLKCEKLSKSQEEKKVTDYINIEEQLEQIFETKEDDIAKELDKIFQDEQSELDEIFGSSNKIDDPEINSILREIEHANLPLAQTYDNQFSFSTKDLNESNQNLEKIPTCETHEKQNDALKFSLWPCELHMRRQKLRNLLSKIGEEFGIRCHENLRLKFLVLFGEDEEDVFAPYSPTLELDDILISSCKKRIAPWIVKYLMIPMTEGKIGSRLIFKKFAKKIAHKIILEDQYPSEQYVKASIENYFSLYPPIMALEQIKI
ncbi:uncharacterized protein LOC129616141 [Condylostylus longicornis]|uniref:uncharacterized protein LOC129616141 n=1 Tax=Condylostylus longicornis TaxID=2530218 RepID=UPI00244E13AA|nr:uncharacterized protein LOC129616141 [Condylostylus longicornis]